MVFLAVDALGIAAVLTAIGLLIPTLVAGYVTLRKVSEVTHKVAQIDAAVNGKAPGEQSISGQVEDLHAQIPVPPPELPHNGDGMYALVRHIADKVDRLEKEARER